MASVFEQPLMFDTPLICNQISKISENIDGVKIIYLKRNLKSVCNSILAARKKRFGTINKYYGAKPKTWEKIKKLDDPIEQVLQQVYDLNNEIEENLNIISSENIFTLDIALLREKPIEVSDSISKFIKVKSSPRNINYPTFINRDKVSFFDKTLEVKFKETWSQIFFNSSKISKRSNKKFL